MSSIPFTQFVREQWNQLPLTISKKLCLERTYIVTGANTGLGLEAARHLAALGSKKVILGVRNMKAGKEAKRDIEVTTGKHGVVEVWSLDLTSYASVQAFAKKAIMDLDRIDGVIENASVAYDSYKLGSEGHEESIVINVLSTFLLAVLLLPKLKESARASNSITHLSLVSSEVAFLASARKELDKIKDDPLRKMDDKRLCDFGVRYPLSKLIQVLSARQLASMLHDPNNGVVLNYVNPGLCKTSLSRHGKISTRLMVNTMKNIFGRTAEQGSRNLLFGVTAGKESHGCFIGNCEIEDDRVPDWITNTEGQETQKRVWNDIVKELDSIEPGCIQRID